MIAPKKPSVPSSGRSTPEEDRAAEERQRAKMHERQALLRTADIRKKQSAVTCCIGLVLSITSTVGFFMKKMHETDVETAAMFPYTSAKELNVSPSVVDHVRGYSDHPHFQSLYEQLQSRQGLSQEAQQLLDEMQGTNPWPYSFVVAIILLVGSEFLGRSGKKAAVKVPPTR